MYVFTCEREKPKVFVFVCVRACMCVCACASVWAYERKRINIYIIRGCVCGRKRGPCAVVYFEVFQLYRRIAIPAEDIDF